MFVRFITSNFFVAVAYSCCDAVDGRKGGSVSELNVGWDLSFGFFLLCTASSIYGSYFVCGKSLVLRLRLGGTF